MKPKISHIQLRGLIVSIVIGVGVLTMQKSLVQTMGTDGWIAIIIGGFTSSLSFCVYYNIFKLHPNKDFFEIGRLTVGSVLTKFFMMFFIIYYLILLALVSRTLGELIKIFLLQTTPLEVIIITFILASTYLASYEIDKVTRASYFIYPIIILFTVMVIFTAIPGSDLTNILPVFRTDLQEIVSGVGNTVFSFMGIEIVLLAIPFVEQKEKVFKTGIYAISIITAIYLIMFFMTITNFSQEQITSQNFPILVLIRQLDAPGLFLENLDGLVMGLWVLVVFVTMVPGYFAMAKFSSKLFKTKKHKQFVLGAVPIVYLIAMIPDNFLQITGNLTYVYYVFAVISGGVIPLIILITGLIRKRLSK